MMKTIYYAATSLNGFLADENNSLDWLMQLTDPPESYKDFIAGIGALAMGATTYQWLIDHELSKGRPWPYTMPAFVFTHRNLQLIPGADIRIRQGSVVPVHREMVELARGKNIWIVGGGELAAAFYDSGLLNEMIIQVASITLAGGAPLFPRRMRAPMELKKVVQIGKSLAELYYEIPAKVPGTFAGNN